MQPTAKTKIVVFIGLLALMLYFGYERASQTPERRLLEQNGPDHTDLATLSDSELRLLLFVEEVRINPRFSLSATNLEHLDQVITELEVDREQFKILYTEPNEQKTIEQYMLPTDFLRQLAQTEHSRRNVLQNPSLESAHQYLVELDLTTNAYQEYITKTQSSLTEFESFPMGFLDGFIKRDDFNDWLTGLVGASKTTQEWIALKRACLEQYQVQCAWEVDEPALSTFQVERVSRPDQESLEFVDYFIANENRNANGVFDDQTATTTTIVFQGLCSSTGNAHNVRFWRNEDGDMSLPYVRFLYEDDIMFFDHVANAYFFSALMIEQGIPYQYQPINHYLCHQHEDDLSTLTAVEAVLEYINEQPDYSTKTGHASLQELRDMEEKLRRSTTSVAVTAVVAYMAKVNSVLNTELSADDREQLQALLLAYRDRSKYFAQRLNLLNKLLDPIADSFAQAAVPNPFYNVIVHSALPMTLLSYNQTVIKNIDSPISNYRPPNEYPNIVKGLDELRSKDLPDSDVIDYLEHTLQVLDKVQKDQL